jgi:hypothetical protein
VSRRGDENPGTARFVRVPVLHNIVHSFLHAALNSTTARLLTELSSTFCVMQRETPPEDRAGVSVLVHWRRSLRCLQRGLDGRYF